MTRLNTLLAVLLATTAFASVAHAAETTTTTTSYHSDSYYHWNPVASDTTGMYIAGEAGGSFPTNDLDDDGVYSLALGWQFMPMVRAELEGGYRNNDLDVGTGHANTWTWMLNGYYDFKNDSMITPYLGAGLGYAHSQLHAPGVDEGDGAFVWQAIAGASFNLTPNWAITADYRYIDTGNFDYTAATSFDYTAQEVRGGLRYTF